MTDDRAAGATLAVHEALRHEFARLPITVKAVADANAERARVVSDHVVFMCDWLASAAGIVTAELGDALAETRTLAVAWANEPGHQQRAALHTQLIALERGVLHDVALADRVVQASAERGAVDDAAVQELIDQADAQTRAIRIGLVVADASPANRRAFIESLPADIRTDFDAEGLARYEAYRARLTDY